MTTVPKGSVGFFLNIFHSCSFFSVLVSDCGKKKKEKEIKCQSRIKSHYELIPHEKRLPSLDLTRVYRRSDSWGLRYRIEKK